MVLTLEQRVLATTHKRLGSHVDYTAVRTSTSDAEKFLSRPSLSLVQGRGRTLFVSEAKTDTTSLQDNVPRAVCEMYHRAKQLRKNIIRGTVTDGCSWIFLVLKMNPNGDGAIYVQTLEPITVMINVAPLGHPELSRTVCDVIAGIISCWVEHGNEDIGDDDWFYADWDFETERIWDTVMTACARA